MLTKVKANPNHFIFVVKKIQIVGKMTNQNKNFRNILNLPASSIGSNVISISENAFRGVDGSQIVVNTCSGSMAESFAQRNGLAVDYYDSMEDALIVK